MILSTLAVLSILSILSVSISYPVPSHPILSYPLLSFPVLSYLSYPISVLPYPIVSYVFFLSYLSYLSMYPPTYLSIYLSVYRSIDRPIYLVIYPSIYLSIFLSIYLFICLSMFLSSNLSKLPMYLFTCAICCEFYVLSHCLQCMVVPAYFWLRLASWAALWPIPWALGKQINGYSVLEWKLLAVIFNTILGNQLIIGVNIGKWIVSNISTNYPKFRI